MEENTIEIIEDVVDEVADTVTIVKNNPILIAGVALVAASTGAALGYWWAQKKLTLKYEAIIENEVHEAKEYYAQQYKADEYATPESAVEKLIPAEERESETFKDAKQALVNYAGIAGREEVVEIEVEEETVISSNIFVNGEPLTESDYDEEYDAEVLKSQGKPYAVTEDVAMENELDYESTQYTWYAKDGVLVDDRDEEVQDVDGTVGEINMTKFGFGGTDKNIVFIQNDKLEQMIEVARSKGAYSEEVLGLRHSDDDNRRPPVRRFRGDDE